MSRHRNISTTISLDKLVNRLAREEGDFAALLYTWMIPHTEDSAQITGDVEELTLTVVPGFRHHSEADVESAVAAMDRLGLVVWDREAGVVYFDTDSYYRHQSYIPRAKRADNAEKFRQCRKSPKNSEEQRESPQNTASLSLSLSPSLSLKSVGGRCAPTGAEKSALRGEFEGWWAAYGRIGDKARARDLYLWWRTTGGAVADELLAAATTYRGHCAATDCKMKHAATFLAKPTKTKSAIWPEYASGEEHGAMDVAATTHLSDVLTAGAEAFGLTGGSNGNGARALGRGRSARAVAGGQDAGRSVAKGQLEG